MMQDWLPSYYVSFAAISAPVWAPLLADINSILTLITLLGGLVLLGYKLKNELNKKDDK